MAIDGSPAKPDAGVIAPGLLNVAEIGDAALEVAGQYDGQMHQSAAAIRIHALDALRFAAALVVLLHHWHATTTPDLRSSTGYPEALARHGGMLGVSLFFLISGYVILRSARGLTAGRFLANRAIRLYPAFWICCTLTWLFSRGDPVARTAGEYIVNLTMFPFAAAVAPVDGVYWTLAIEAKFYLLIAALIATGRPDRIEPVMWGWLLVSQLAFDPATRSLVVANYAPYFVAGCALALLAGQRTRWRILLFVAAAAAAIPSTVSQARLVGQLYKVTPDLLFAVIAMASLFAVMVAITQGWVRLPGWRIITLSGAISYPLYLLHADIGRRFFEVAKPAIGDLAYPIALLWILAVAWVVVRWGEGPVRTALRRMFATPQPHQSGDSPGATVNES